MCKKLPSWLSELRKVFPDHCNVFRGRAIQINSTTCISWSARSIAEVNAVPPGDDDSQKSFCDDEFAKSAQEKKDTEEAIASLAASIEEMTATVSTLTSEIETLQALFIRFLREDIILVLLHVITLICCCAVLPDVLLVVLSWLHLIKHDFENAF